MTLVRSVARVHDEIRSCIDRGDLDGGLRLIHRVVDQVFCEPINTAQVFGSELLDGLCQEIGAINWRRICDENQSAAVQSETATGRTVVHIASRLYASGGHTAALADMIRLAPPARNIILVTGIGGPTDHAAIQHRFESIPNLSFEYAPRGKHVAKLDWIQRRLHTLDPCDVWLYNHHQDSVAVAAVQPGTRYRLHYYHHGDHHLCLGVHLGHADHIDMHPMGFHHCRDELGIRDNRYLPLVVADQGDRPASQSFISGAGLLTCTAAGANKLEIPYFVSYIEVIPELLRASAGTHLHIGRLSPVALYRIRRGMRKLGVPTSSFIYIPFVRSVWKTLQEYRVDLYVASFPYGGARTLIEAMGAGIPVAVHCHYASRLLGSIDMAYDGALIWKNPKELYAHVRHVDAAILNEHSRLARQRYEKFHGDYALKSALADPATSLQAPDLVGAYRPDGLQRALDISSQVNCSGAIRRALFRTARKLKWLLPNL
jgi:hypothetical protein